MANFESLLGVAVRPSHKVADQLLDQLIAVRVTLKLPQHDVVVQIQKVIPAIFREDQWIGEDGMRSSRRGTEVGFSRDAHRPISDLFHHLRQLVAYAPEDGPLVLLKVAEFLLQLVPDLLARMPRIVVISDLLAAAQNYAAELGLHFAGEKLEDGRVSQ